MVIGILQIELLIGDATSLKDKRRVVRSVKDKLHQDHLVAVAEVDRLDAHQHAVLGIVTVSNSVSYTQSLLSRIVKELQHHRQFILNDHRTEILTGE